MMEQTKLEALRKDIREVAELADAIHGALADTPQDRGASISSPFSNISKSARAVLASSDVSICFLEAHQLGSHYCNAYDSLHSLARQDATDPAQLRLGVVEARRIIELCGLPHVFEVALESAFPGPGVTPYRDDD